jgi:hypothetical protein
MNCQWCRRTNCYNAFIQKSDKTSEVASTSTIRARVGLSAQSFGYAANFPLDAWVMRSRARAAKNVKPPLAVFGVTLKVAARRNAAKAPPPSR